MANLADIPDELLDGSRLDDFVNWIMTQPLDLRARTSLAQLWTTEMGIRFTLDQWTQIRTPDQPPITDAES